MSYLKPYLNQTVDVIIDRPIGSSHPEYIESIYPINYGFVPNTKTPDGKEIDAYVLGVDKPLEIFEGICIAVIHRFDDNEDKLVIVPKNAIFTNKEIEKQTNFQEQYFKSMIIR